MAGERPPYSLKAPARSSGGAPMRLPGRDSLPNVDEHLVQPEVTRDEIIGGRRVVAQPATEPHADQQSELDYVLRAHAARGYRASADLITRHDMDSDFASDACLRKEGIDPETGTRYLEEIAFEVVSEQNERNVSEKASRMLRRGVRRVFALFVKGRRRVCEWSTESGGWRALEPDSRIEDPSLALPLAVRALVDAAAADNAVVEALAAKGNPALRQREAATKADAILKVLQGRGLAVSDLQRQKILLCHDLDRLNTWLLRAGVAPSVDEVTVE